MLGCGRGGDRRVPALSRDAARDVVRQRPVDVLARRLLHQGAKLRHEVVEHAGGEVDAGGGGELRRVDAHALQLDHGFLGAIPEKIAQ